jgi:NAD(P)-dependent dehydrogenase (short-subunit alcohol dehydrogenase family)
MQIAGSTALATGANRPLGRHLAEQLLGRGAVIYADARNPDTIDLPGAVMIAFDVADPASIAAAAEAAHGVMFLVYYGGS